MIFFIWECCVFTVALVSASGSNSAGELVKNLSTDSRSSVHPTGSQRSNNTPAPPKSVDGNSAAIYAAFISALSGSISLQLIRRHDAVPLGSRTVFTAVERDGYASPMINNDTPSAIPSVTTLHIQLTAIGKLTVSSRTVAQPGISRLRCSWDQPDEVRDIDPGTDIWLSPNGTIARLVTPNPDSPAVPSPNPVVNTARHTQWKSTVLEWLRNFGLCVTSIEEEIWVEVEVWEPFYAKLAGEVYRQNQENQSATPLKRVLWPARYCFRRAKSTPLGYSTEGASLISGDPVDVAAEWIEAANSIPMEVDSKLCPDHQEDQTHGQEASPSKFDFPEGIETLSRIAQYPDLQTASLVYPTPPDGPIAMGFNHSNTEAFADDSDIGLSQLQKERTFGDGERPPSENPFDPDMTMGVGPSPGLVVGSGLYDTNDDDLFEDMNERDFGAKGITDADFNFFDDPGFGGMDNSTPVGNIQGTPQATAGLEEPKMDTTTHYELPENHSENQPPAVREDVSQEIGNTPAMSSKETVPRDDSGTPRNGNSQPISPPLSPVEVKRILFSGPKQDNHHGKEGQKHNHYNPVTFDRSMSDWDQKYGSDGKFWFSSSKNSSVTNPVDSVSEIPTIGIPSRSGKFKTLAESPGKLLNDNTTPSSGLKQGQRSSSVSSNDTSGSSDDMAPENDSDPPVLTSLKRKRAPSSSDSSPSSPGGLRKDTDQEIPTDKVDSSTFLGNFLSVFSDWSMVGYFSASQNQALPVLPRRKQQVQIGQLLVDQVAYSSLNHNLDAEIAVPDLENEIYFLGTSLEEMAIMNESGKLDLKGFVSLQDGCFSPPDSDEAVSGQTTQRKDGETGVISKIPPPHLRVRRGKDYLEALPPIVSFWETFGLEPAHGAKDISAYCIYPRNAAAPADSFLERFGLLYSNCNLGEHVRGERSEAFERGLAPWGAVSAGGSSYSDMMQSLGSLCEDLGMSTIGVVLTPLTFVGRALATSRSSKESIVLYIINPFAHAAALADVCAAFWQLFQIYAAEVDKDQTLPVDELVLQIIPMSFVMAPDSVIVPSQAEYLSLALEVYSRCPPTDPGSCLIDSAPPVVLEESFLKGINFKLTSETLSPLMEGRCLHVACSRSLDQRWITVAWSNNTGSLQRTMSYCLRFRDSSVSRGIGDVRNEIWTATRDIVEKIHARWRVIIVHTEPVDQEDVDGKFTRSKC